MFRVSRFMNEILHPTPAGTRRDAPGPVVIWNLVRRCNLACMHCYSISADVDFPGELSTSEVLSVMHDLKLSGVPAWFFRAASRCCAGTSSRSRHARRRWASTPRSPPTAP